MGRETDGRLSRFEFSSLHRATGEARRARWWIDIGALFRHHSAYYYIFQLKSNHPPLFVGWRESNATFSSSLDDPPFLLVCTLTMSYIICLLAAYIWTRNCNWGLPRNRSVWFFFLFYSIFFCEAQRLRPEHIWSVVRRLVAGWPTSCSPSSLLRYMCNLEWCLCCVRLCANDSKWKFSVISAGYRA